MPLARLGSAGAGRRNSLAAEPQQLVPAKYPLTGPRSGPVVDPGYHVPAGPVSTGRRGPYHVLVDHGPVPRSERMPPRSRPLKGGVIVGLRLTPAAYRHGLAFALPEAVMARPTGVGRAIATYSLPIEGRDEWLAAARRQA